MWTGCGLEFPDGYKALAPVVTCHNRLPRPARRTLLDAIPNSPLALRMAQATFSPLKRRSGVFLGFITRQAPLIT